MTALSAERSTQRDGVDAVVKQLYYPVAASTKIYAGGLVSRNASGYMVPASSALTQAVIGVAMETVDNTSGSNGTKSIRIERGAFWFANSASTDAITVADITNSCFVVDDNVVAKTAGSGGTRQAAGRILDVSSTLGVLVEVGGANPVSGVYTPTFTSGTNTTAGASLVGFYSRVGNVVHFTVRGSITHTAGSPTASTFELSLPITSDLAAAGDLAGVVTGANVTAGHLTAQTTNNTMQFNYSIGATGAQAVSASGSYLVL